MSGDDHIYDNIAELQRIRGVPILSKSNPAYDNSDEVQENIYDDNELTDENTYDGPETLETHTTNGSRFSRNARYNNTDDEDYLTTDLPTIIHNPTLNNPQQEVYAEIPASAYEGVGIGPGVSYNDVRPTAPPPTPSRPLSASQVEVSPVTPGYNEAVKEGVCCRCACSVVLVAVLVICIGAIVVLGYMVHLSKKDIEELRISSATKIDNLRYWSENEIRELENSMAARSLAELKKKVERHTEQLEALTEDTTSLEGIIESHTEHMEIISSNITELKSEVDDHTNQLASSGGVSDSRFLENQEIIKRIISIPSLMVSYPRKPTIARFVKPTVGRNANGRPYWYGTIEVQHKNTWGTVCNNRFNEASARVLCRMVGFTTGVYEGNTYRQNLASSANIWLDDVVCNGDEPNIDECDHGGWGVNNCNHNQDVGVRCSDEESIMRFPNAITSSSSVQGHVEIFYKNQWGTLCDDRFTDTSARVLCQSAGFRTGDFSNNRYRQTSANKAVKIWLDDVRCDGSESWVGECPHRGWGLHNCGHNEDVGVRCSNEASRGHADSSTILSKHFYTDLNATFLGHKEPSGGQTSSTRSYTKSSDGVESCIKNCKTSGWTHVSIEVDKNPIGCTCHINPTKFRYSANSFLYIFG